MRALLYLAKVAFAGLFLAVLYCDLVILGILLERSP